MAAEQMRRANEQALSSDEPESLHCSDYGNALRLVRKHGTDIRYCHDWAMWLVWDGIRWKKDITG